MVLLDGYSWLTTSSDNAHPYFPRPPKHITWHQDKKALCMKNVLRHEYYCWYLFLTFKDSPTQNEGHKLQSRAPEGYFFF